MSPRSSQRADTENETDRVTWKAVRRAAETCRVQTTVPQQLHVCPDDTHCYLQ